MNIIAMSADEFQGVALAWVGVLSAILIAVLSAVPVIIAKLATAKEAINQLGGRVQDHSNRISATNTRLNQVALSVTPQTIEPQNK